MLNPAYFGICDLTEQHIATKDEFSSKDWNELKKIFKSTVQWKSIKTSEEIQTYFDGDCTLPNSPTNELEKFHVAVQYISSIMYPARTEAITEGHYTSAYIFPLFMSILTDNDSFKIEWGETMSLSSSEAVNNNENPKKEQK
ncbi:hypothetical protein F8M41_005592 [Gigaspora margarita]|uniref:Uncharacterized protein n=1 Tax=Gigaspora margarita TaxID=4874 RepID=A0A8H4AX65_GIGMA|nr:hypothetical protein F8M41_005592 [Gigaspora margarita]